MAPEENGSYTIEEYLLQNGSITYKFHGTSMMPMLRQSRGDLITVEAKGERRCRRFDVALYRSATVPGRYILHRVVKVTPGGYTFLGDNCIAFEHVSEERVIGILQSFHRGRGGLFANRSCNAHSRACRLYGRLWFYLFPLRYLYKKARSLAGKCFRALKMK